MLDIANVHVASMAPRSAIFTESDPIQATLRAILDRLDESEFVELERDLEYLEFSGEVTRRLEALLGLATYSAPLAKVA